MAYLILNKESKKYEKAPGFDRLLFITPDVRHGECANEAELKQKYQQFFDGVRQFCETDRKWVSESALVITPLICDSRFVEGQPEKKENYIVSYLDDVGKQLIEDVIVKSKKSLGDEDRAQFGFYFMIEVSPEFPLIQKLGDADPNSEEYQGAVHDGHMNIAAVLAEDLIDQKLRSFLAYPSVGYVEQYWDRHVKDLTDGWPLAEGYQNSSTPEKRKRYIVANDMFLSTGYQFAQYALSKDETVALRAEYFKSPWVK